MEIINIKNGFESGLHGGVIAIGNFDGIHKGHAFIAGMIKAEGTARKKPVGILTFEPNPLTYFTGNENFHLTNFEQKVEVLEKLGLDFVAYAEFNEAFSRITAENFVRDILVDKMKVSHVFTGDDFKFGYKAAGNAKMLGELSDEYRFKYTPVEKIEDDEGERYSSTRARILIETGKVDEAKKILGRNFEIEGVVQKGMQKARELGFPTMNIKLDGYIRPLNGVYECEADIDGKTHKAVANIGVKPTFKENKDNPPILEVHVPNVNISEMYGKKIAVRLKAFVRKELKFGSIQDLKHQIQKDVENVGKR